MAARRGTAAVQGTAALAAARLRRFPRGGPRCPDSERAGHRPGCRGLRRRADVRHALVPQRIRLRLGRQRPRRWPLGGASKRRRGEERKDPTLEVSDLHAAETTTFPSQDFGQDDPYGRDDSVFGQRPATAAESTSVYEPQPLPDDTGQYGVYSDAAYAAATDPAYAAAAQAQGQQSQDPLGQNYSYDGYSGYDQQQYGYDTGQQQQYAAYSDPYIGTQAYDAASYGQPYDASQQQYTQQGYTQDPYATNGGYVSETPAGGVWVPQQRNTEDQYGGELPPEQSYPYDGNGNNGTNGGNGQQGGGYDEQYRF